MIVKDLVKVYHDGGEEKRALDGVSLDLPASGLIAIVGNCGAGKSALLNILGGVEIPDGGELIADGKSYKNCARGDLDCYRAAKVALVNFDDDLVGSLNARENVELALRMQGKLNAAARAQELLESVGYDDYFTRKPASLSAFRKRQVSLARALAKDNAAILADDPTAGVSGEEAAQLMNTLKRLSDGRLVVVATRDRALAEKYADRIVELDAGRIAADRGAMPFAGADDAPSAAVTVARPRLPLLFAVRLAAKALQCRPIVFIMIMFVAIVAFGNFGAYAVMATYDADAATVSALTGSQYDAAVLRKRFVVRERSTRYMRESGRLSQSVTEYETRYDTGIPASEIGKYDNSELGVRFAGVFGLNGAAGLGVEVLNYASGAATSKGYYYGNADGFTDAGEDYLTDVFGADACLAGAYPTANDEIAISEYTYEAIAARGLRTFDAASGEYGETVAVGSPAEAVGQRLVVGTADAPLPLTITGVYRTGALEGKYYEEKKEYDFDDVAAFTATYPNCRTGFRRLFYVADGFYDAFVYKLSPSALQFGYNSVKCDLSDHKRRYPGNSDFYFVFPETLMSFGDRAAYYAFTDGALLSSETVGGLDYNETLISVPQLRNLAQRLLNAYKQQKAADEREYYENDLFKEAFDRLSESDRRRVDDPARSDDVRTLLRAIAADWDEWILNNTATDEDYRTAANTLYFQTGNEEMTIKGVYDVGAAVSGRANGYALTHGFVTGYGYEYRYDEVRRDTRYVNPTDCKYAAVVTPLKTDADTLKYLFGLNKPIADDSCYELDGNVVYEHAQGSRLNLAFIGAFLLMTAIIGAVIALVLIAGYISASIGDARREIGVLRSLGARGSCLFKIFFTESVMLALICALPAMGVAAIVCLLFDSSFATSLFSLSLLHFTFVGALAVLGVSLAVTALGAFLPVLRASKKAPVRTIRPR